MLLSEACDFQFPAAILGFTLKSGKELPERTAEQISVSELSADPWGFTGTDGPSKQDWSFFTV